MESSTVNPPQRNVSRLAPAILIGGFVLAMLPLADSYILYHPDERYYSNAAFHRYRTASISGVRQAIRSAQWILASKETFADLDLTGWYYVTTAHELFPEESSNQIHRDLRQGLLGKLIRAPKTTMVLAHRDLVSERP